MNQLELYWKYESIYPFKIEEISEKPFRDFFADVSDKMAVDFYFRLNRICAEMGDMPNFMLPFVGANYFSQQHPRILMIAESKYVDFKDVDITIKERDIARGRLLFNWLLDCLINGTDCAPSKEIQEYIHTYKYSLFNQEPFISYIKVRSAELGFPKMRYRDFRGWPFPALVRGINTVYGYEGTRNSAQLNTLKEIAYINYYQIPFPVDGSKEENGFTYDKFSQLVNDKTITWEMYCKQCDMIMDIVIDFLQPDLIVFASKNGMSNYKGKYKDKIAVICHPAQWRFYNDKQKLEGLIRALRETY